MNTKHLSVLVPALAALALFAGCASEPGGMPPQDSTKYTLENTENFELLGQATLADIAGTGLQPRTLPDGRLEVVASVKNRQDHKVKIQVSCVFKNDQGFSTEANPPSETIELAPNATEAVRFTAATTLAKKYTIRVREVH